MNANRTPAWELILETVHPGLGRPRFFSLHTLATLTNRTDLKELAVEMKNTGRVAVCYCPYARAIVFFPSSLAKAYGDWKEQWDRIDAELVRYPFPAIRGFDASKTGNWAGGGIGRGAYTPPDTTMKEPFAREDYAYANTIIAKLKAAGFEPGIKEYEAG